MTERSQAELLKDAHWRIFEGSTRLTKPEARALLEAYLETKRLLQEALIEAQRAADDAAAQRAVVERLTNELDQYKKR